MATVEELDARQYSFDSANTDRRWANNGVINSRRLLRHEIWRLIAPYRDSIQRPPFSNGELVVLSIICSYFDHMPREDIMEWIVRTFAYFSDLAFKSYVQELSRIPDQLKSKTSSSPNTTAESFNTPFTPHEIPLIEVGDNPSYWTCKYSQARIFLRTHLEPARKGIFPFFDLPSELRNRIYELLLLYPFPGLSIESATQHSVSIRINSLSSPSTPWPTSQTASWHTIKPPSQTLNFLLTSRQLHNEAIPIYYSLNTFSFAHQYLCAAALQKLSLNRISHLRNLHIHLQPDQRNRTRADKLYTTPLPSLQLSTLSLSVSDTQCQVSEFKDYGDLPGMEFILRLARSAEKVEIRECWDARIEGPLSLRKFEEFIESKGIQSTFTGNTGAARSSGQRSWGFHVA